MPILGYEITAENKALLKSILESEKSLDELGVSAKDAGNILDNALKINKQTQKESEAAISQLNLRLKENTKILNDAEKEYDRLAQDLDKVFNPHIKGGGDDFVELQNILKEVRSTIYAYRKENQELVKDENSLIAKQKQLVSEHNNLESSYKKIKDAQRTYYTQMREVREEMSRLRNADGGISPENIQKYDELKKKLEQLGTVYRVVQQEQKQLTTSGSQLSGLLSGLSGLAGAFSSVQGVMSLFIKNNDQLVAIQTKLQSAMSITVGLQQLSNTLHQTSTFRITTVSKVTELWAVAVNRLTVALGGSRLAAQALMGVLSLGLSVAITAVIAALNKYISSQRKLNEEQKKFSDSVSSSVSSVLVQYESLRKEWIKTDGNLAEQQKLLSKNSEAYNRLGVEINNVNDAENLFNNGSEAFKTAITQRAMAAAAMELAAEKYKESIQKMIEADKLPDKVNVFTGNGMFGPARSELLDNKKKQGLIEESNSALEEVQKIVDQANGLNEKALKELEKAGIKSIDTIAEGTKKHYQNLRDSAQKELNSLTKDQFGSERWKSLIKQRDEAAKMLEIWDPAPKKTNKELDRENQRKLDAEQKLNERINKLADERVKKQRDIEQKSIDLMDDSFEKRYAQLNLNYKKEIDAIKEFETRKANEQYDAAKEQYVKDRGTDIGFDFSKFDLTSLPEGLRPEDIKAQAEELANIASQIWAAARAKLVEDEVAFEREEELRFADSLQRELGEIKDYYNKRVKEAKGNSKLIEQVEKNRETAIINAHIEANLRRISHDEEMNLRRLELSEKFYLFESDKIREQLNIQLKAAKQIEESLQKKYDNSQTDEVAQDLENAKIEVEELEQAIKKLDADKFREIAEFASQIASGLSELFGGSMGVGFGWISDLATAAGQIASLDPKQVADGVMKIALTVKDIINANKEANREIKAFYSELEQMAISYSISIIENLKDVKSAGDSIFYSDNSNALLQGMRGYNEAIIKQSELMSQLGDVTVKTGVKKKKFIGITTGTKDVFDNLLKTYPDIIKEDGKLNRQLAETLLQSGNLSKEATDLINNIIQTEEVAISAMQQVESILSNLAGSVGNDLKNALVDAFKNGTDSAKTFGDSVSKIMENIITDMIFTAAFGDLLSDLEVRMKNSFSENGDKNIVDDLVWFANAYEQREEMFGEDLKKAQEALAPLGFDILQKDNNSSRSSSPKGITSITQDSANELNANFFNLRQTASEIRDFLLNKDSSNVALTANTEFIASSCRQNTTIFQNQLQLQVQIERNTYKAAQGISELINSGVKIKEAE